MIQDNDLEEHKSKLVFEMLNSAEELREWMSLYFGIYFPMGVVHPDSTHSPTEAMWRIYELMKTGESENVPQVCMLSSRDSYKTLSAAAIEVLCMIHFRISVAHMAAIEPQSQKAVQYVELFFRRIGKYLENHGWKKNSNNKRVIEWITDDGRNIYLKIIIATIAGANSEHVPMLFIDEVDVVQNPKALEEAKMIPSVFGKYFPMTVYLSTRKFAGGLMEKTLKQTIAAGGEVLRWNILDITERVPVEIARINEPKVVRYLGRGLPMVNLSESEWAGLTDEHRNDYERFEAYAGIATHPLLPVMRNYLVDRNQEDVGYLYKPVSAVKNNFNQLSPDMAEAQLMCQKPSTSGLVYPRFDGMSNVISIQDCFLKLTGEIPHNTSHEFLRDMLVNLGITFIGGADWGYTDYTSLVVLALIPNGEVWLVDSFIQDKLELDDIVKYIKELNQLWSVDKWYVDQAYPAYIATLKRHGLKCPEFKKVVADGIAAIQSRIVDSSNTRRFFILDIPKNKHYIDSFGEYKWQLDRKGDVIEGEPYHDSDGYSDALDSLRYPFQNIFAKGGKIMFTYPLAAKENVQLNGVKEAVAKANTNIMVNKIKELAPNYENEKKDDTAPTKKKVLWM